MEDRWKRIKEKVAKLPSNPGVYQMLDASGNIIYIGKAKNLKHRVSSYFVNNSNHTEKVRQMVSHVDTFEYIITNTELEALNLESNLIKAHQPFYNILLKDGKAHPYFRLQLKEDFPRLEITRKIKKDGAKYFGPYFGSIQIRDVAKVIEDTFCLRTCKHKLSVTKGLKRECLNYHIGRCLAPCTFRVTKAEYRKEVQKVIDFLNGDQSIAREVLTKKMYLASSMEQYEKAMEYRDHIKMLDYLNSKMITELTVDVDLDVFGFSTNGQLSCVSVLVVRNGKLLGANQFTVLDASIQEKDTIQNFITQYYHNNNIIPKEIVIKYEDDDNIIQNWLIEQAQHKVTVTTPQRGIKRQLLKLADENAKDYLERNIEKEKLYELKTMGAMTRLQQVLSLPKLPRRIEGFDISNIQGSHIVSSMVVFVNGEKASKMYRKFKIKTVEDLPNDFASMKETLSRRLQELKGNDISFSTPPDLILIDGGKGQLKYAYQVMQDLGYNFPMISLAKQDEEIYLPHQSEPIRLSKDDYALKLLQHVRDESHHFAITFHRSLRDKNMIHSQLTDIPLIGKKKAKELLQYFQTIGAIKNATKEELAFVPSISTKLAENIFNYFHKTEQKK